MYQRLLFTLSTLFIGFFAISQGGNVMTPSDTCYKYNKDAAVGTTTNPTVPTGAPVLIKWVHDPSQNGAGRANSGSNADTIGSHGFDQSTYKCYRYGSTAFRIRFPNNYDPNNADKYPLILFFHGAGEAAHTSFANNANANRENQDQLYWGAQLFEQRMNQGEWNGFLLFPQIMNNSSQWDISNPAFSDITNILDTLQKYNGFDPDRLVTMGLSAGGYGSVTFANYFPKRVASVVSSNPRFIEGLINQSTINNFLQIPIWVAFGGLDDFPGPEQVMQFRDSVSRYGGNIYATYHGSQGHSSWSYQWAQKDASSKYIVSSYWNAAHKAQPLLYYQNSTFCTGSPISAKMALTQGFAAYEWQYDGGGGFVSIPGASSYTYTATQTGQYRVHFKRSLADAWSAWTPKPVVISTKTCTADTAFAEHFESMPISDYITFSGGPVFANSPYSKNNYTCQNGIFVNGTEAFSQDGTGKLGGRFMVNNTLSGCSYFAGDQVWRTYNNASVTPNTDYIFSFYMGNQSSGTNLNGSNPASPITTLTAKINGVILSPATAQAVLSGDVSWKKYSFIWNSGNNNSAELAITNNSASTNGNNFVLDEITLVKSKASFPIPGAAFGDLTLWAKANSINNDDGDPLGLWTNSGINGDNLAQASSGALPIFKNNDNDNINFNPVVDLSAAKGQFMQARNGFSGTDVHTAVHAFVVARFNSLTQDDKNIFLESQRTQSFIPKEIRVTLRSQGRISWTAGTAASISSTNTVYTPNNSIEVGKPILWSFSKDNNNTPDGNKQDIRKNGVLVGSNNNSSTITGNTQPFNLSTSGKFIDGSVAEVVYLLDSTLTPLAQNKIESYLALKYGTTLGSTTAPVSYTASDGTTVFWPANAGYQNDVFGIGTDSASGLVQNISNSVNSGSGNGTGQSAKGNLVLATGTILGDNRFLVIGNDAGTLAQHVISSLVEASPAAQGATIVGRKWKVYNTGAVGAVNLSFDSTGLGNLAGGSNKANYALIIDTDGDGNLATGTLTFFTATGASGKKITFSGVVLNNGVVFTLITLKSATLLPAVWLGFAATAVNSNALLNWKTSDEMNVDHYAIEHSFNGVSFSAVGTVAANNASGTNNYNFTHADLAAGIHYYRIRRIDKDGKSEYSDTKAIKIASSGANVQVRPNPVIGATLVLAVSTQQSNKTNVQVTGVDGKIIVQQNISLAAGNNTININIATVPPGVYLVRMLLNDEMVTKKFIKER
ncbi:MAG: T9SS type A sorting domain-containing protein [Bacteroidota bacterium]